MLAFLLTALAGPAWSQPADSAARVSLDVQLARTAVLPGESVEAAVVFNIDEGWHANAHEPTLEYLIGTTLTVEPLEGFVVLAIRYPPPEQFSFSFAGGQTLDVYTGRVPVFLTLRAAGDLQPGRYALQGTLRIQICNDEICLPPSTLSAAIPVQVTDDPAAIRPVNEDLFAEADASAGGLPPTGGEATDAEARIASMFGERGQLLALMGVLVIGLALNLTPCVYPMLSVTVSLFGSREETRVGPSFGRALVYVAGIVTMYSLLGAAAAYTGALFGSWLQNPWMLAGIGILLLALALSMFGAYELRMPAALGARLGAAHGVSGLLGLYLSGLVVGLFAAPCIGPPIVGLLAFVGAQGDPLFAMSAFSTLGLGLGLPYLVLGTFSGLLGRLPRSGVWMVWVKKVFGVIMVGAALFYLGLAFTPGKALWAVPVTLLTGGLYLGFLDRSGAVSRTFTRLKWSVGTAAILAGLMGFAILNKPTITWQPYSEENLLAAQAQEKLVLLDFYADWCIPCLELDHITFADERVIRATEDFVRIKVDLTRYDSPESEALRERFDVVGVPTLVFLDRNGEEIHELRIVGFIGPDPFLEYVRAAQQTRPDS